MSAGIIGRRPRPHRRRKGKASAALTRPTPIAVVSVVAVGLTLTVTFDQPVLLRGVPQWPAGSPATPPTKATMPSPSSVLLTYPGYVGSESELTVPFEDPAVRNSRGGHVNAGRLAVPLSASAAPAQNDAQPVAMRQAA